MVSRIPEEMPGDISYDIYVKQGNGELRMQKADTPLHTAAFGGTRQHLHGTKGARQHGSSPKTWAHRGSEVPSAIMRTKTTLLDRTYSNGAIYSTPDTLIGWWCFEPLEEVFDRSVYVLFDKTQCDLDKLRFDGLFKGYMVGEAQDASREHADRQNKLEGYVQDGKLVFHLIGHDKMHYQYRVIESSRYHLRGVIELPGAEQGGELPAPVFVATRLHNMLIGYIPPEGGHGEQPDWIGLYKLEESQDLRAIGHYPEWVHKPPDSHTSENGHHYKLVSEQTWDNDSGEYREHWSIVKVFHSKDLNPACGYYDEARCSQPHFTLGPHEQAYKWQSCCCRKEKHPEILVCMIPGHDYDGPWVPDCRMTLDRFRIVLRHHQAVWEEYFSKSQASPGNAALQQKVDRAAQAYRHARTWITRGRLWSFEYKGRLYHGFAVHIAAMGAREGNAEELMFLDAADMSEELAHNAQKQSFDISQVMAHHVAVEQMNKASLDRLLSRAEDVKRLINTKGYLTKPGAERKDNYGALHDAAYVGDVELARYLITKGADVELTNIFAMTPLHVAAASGHDRVAELLVEMKANKHAQCNWKDIPNLTPLQVALRCSFDRSKLFVLCERRKKDIMTVAEADPVAASMLLKDVSGIPHPSWRDGLKEETQKDSEKDDNIENIEFLVQLLRCSPETAADVLEVLTCKPSPPRGGSFYVYQLPVRAYPNSWHKRRCEYPEDNVWRTPATRKKDGPDEPPQCCPPVWHLRLAPGGFEMLNKEEIDYLDDMPRSATSKVLRELPCYRKCCRRLKPTKEWGLNLRYKVPVKMRVCMMPNLVKPEILFEISQVRWKPIYANNTVQALLDFVWDKLVKKQYTAKFLMRSIELIVLLWIVLVPPVTSQARRASWSLLCMTCTRDVVEEVTHLAAYWYVEFRRPEHYFGSNIADLMSTSLTSFMVWRVVFTLDFISDDLTGRNILCIVIFARWIEWLYMLRAYRFCNIGVNIIPLFRSFFAVIGIFLVTMVSFVAFAHSYLALSRVPEEELSVSIVTELLTNAWRLLLLSDGDGIDFVLGLDAHGSDGLFGHALLFVSSFIFCVCILNLFIAVHSTQNDKSTRNSEVLFYWSRAEICSEHLLLARQALKQRLWGGFSVTFSTSLAYVLVLPLSFVLWYCLLQYEAMHPIMATAVLFLNVRFGDRILMELPFAEYVGLDEGPWVDISGLAEWCRCCCAKQKIAPHKGESSDSLNTGDSPHNALSGATNAKSKKVNRYLWWCSWDEKSNTGVEQPEKGLNNRACLEDFLASAVSTNAWLGKTVEKLQRGQDDGYGHIKELKEKVDNILAALNQNSQNSDAARPGEAGGADDAPMDATPFCRKHDDAAVRFDEVVHPSARFQAGAMSVDASPRQGLHHHPVDFFNRFAMPSSGSMGPRAPTACQPGHGQQLSTAALFAGEEPHTETGGEEVRQQHMMACPTVSARSTHTPLSPTTLNWGSLPKAVEARQRRSAQAGAAVSNGARSRSPVPQERPPTVPPRRNSSPQLHSPVLPGVGSSPRHRVPVPRQRLQPLGFQPDQRRVSSASSGSVVADAAGAHSSVRAQSPARSSRSSAAFPGVGIPTPPPVAPRSSNPPVYEPPAGGAGPAAQPSPEPPAGLPPMLGVWNAGHQLDGPQDFDAIEVLD